MARLEAESDFFVDVEDVGPFRFGKRTMRDEIKIQVEYARMIDGVEATQWLSLVAGWIAALKVLVVKAPDGWDIDSMDPLEDETYAKLGRVHSALINKERSFRSGKGQTDKAAGQGESHNS